MKPSFSFLDNPFAVDVVGDGCPLSSPITNDVAAVELEILELQEDVKRTEKIGSSTLQFWKNVPAEKYPLRKNVVRDSFQFLELPYKQKSSPILLGSGYFS
uniref:Uncharacterized protein n=1 Tax=Cacopsylla melanoneura TaxID=428564 RepID=A0A8D8QC62_9HEMI